MAELAIDNEAGARENVTAAELEAWIRAVPTPVKEDEAAAFFAEKRSGLTAFFTALVVLGAFGGIALAFVSYVATITSPLP